MSDFQTNEEDFSAINTNNIIFLISTNKTIAQAKEVLAEMEIKRWVSDERYDHIFIITATDGEFFIHTPASDDSSRPLAYTIYDDVTEIPEYEREPMLVARTCTVGENMGEIYGIHLVDTRCDTIKDIDRMLSAILLEQLWTRLPSPRPVHLIFIFRALDGEQLFVVPDMPIQNLFLGTCYNAENPEYPDTFEMAACYTEVTQIPHYTEEPFLKAMADS